MPVYVLGQLTRNDPPTRIEIIQDRPLTKWPNLTRDVKGGTWLVGSTSTLISNACAFREPLSNVRMAIAAKANEFIIREFMVHLRPCSAAASRNPANVRTPVSP